MNNIFLTKSFESYGYWYLPNKEKDGVYGILNYDPKKSTWVYVFKKHPTVFDSDH